MKKIEQWVRPNIRQLKPYSSARNEFSGEASVWLDANESPFNPPYNRYPDPLQNDLKEKKIQTLWKLFLVVPALISSLRAVISS